MRNFFTPEQAADRLGWARKTVYRWLAAGWFPGAAQLPNGRWRIPEADLAAIEHPAGTEPEPAA